MARRSGRSPVRDRSALTFYSAWFCPFAQRAHIALEEKCIDYQHVECTLYQGDASTKVALPLSEKRRLNPGFVECSPSGLVPALRDHAQGSVAVHGSLVCVEYIDEAFTGPALLPASPADRARVRTAVAQFDDKARSPFYKLLMAQDAASQTAAAEALLDAWAALADLMDPLSEGPYLLGTHFSSFEVAAWPWFQRLEPVLGTYRGFKLPSRGADSRWDRLHSWADACVSRPSVKRTIVERERLIGNYSGYAGGNATSAVAQALRAADPSLGVATTRVPVILPAASISVAVVLAVLCAPREASATALVAICSFAAMVATLSLVLLSGVRSQAKGCVSDRVLLVSFSIFLFVAWFFEPAVVFLCGWEGLGTDLCQQTLIGRLWHFYASSLDPIFLNLCVQVPSLAGACCGAMIAHARVRARAPTLLPHAFKRMRPVRVGARHLRPLWLRIVCSLDTLLFGPFYAISVYAFATGRQTQRWYETIALAFSGALLYSTIVYFAYEVLAEAHRANLLWVFVVNLPWTLCPCVLCARVMWSCTVGGRRTNTRTRAA